MKLPDQVKVGHITLDVQPMTQKEADACGADGLFNYRLGLLKVNVEQHPTQVLETLLHELLHALWAIAGFHAKDNDEEELVTRLSPLLLMLLQDNPSLNELLQEYLTSDSLKPKPRTAKRKRR